MLEVDGGIPMRWWDKELNMGDLLGPWLVERMTGKKPVWVEKAEPHYLVVGSILGRVAPSTIVWGVGSFGTETKWGISQHPKYLAVRGPLTRAKIASEGIACPRVYGDPALLAPDYFRPEVEQVHEIGVVLRWSEHSRKDQIDVPGVLVIDMLSDDVEGVIRQMLSCKAIIASSLHGLILADAYGIPNAWLAAKTGKGKEFKFWDYFCSVGKLRRPVEFDLATPGLTLEALRAAFPFDGSPIDIDLDALRAANPFTRMDDEVAEAERRAIEGSAMMKQKAIEQAEKERLKAEREARSAQSSKKRPLHRRVGGRIQRSLQRGR